jgi:cytochrome c553
MRFKVSAGGSTMALRVCAVLAATALASCGPVRTTSADRFRDGGALIALSGGEAEAVNACFVCHGLDGGGNGAGAPRLAGLDAGYLERQLGAYADGRRRHAQMAWIARRLTFEDRRAVSAHYAALPWNRPPAASIGRAPPLWTHGDPKRGLAACASCHGSAGEGRGAAVPPLAGQPAAYHAEQLERWRRAERRTDAGQTMLRISRLLEPHEVAELAAFSASLQEAPARPGSRAASP